MEAYSKKQDNQNVEAQMAAEREDALVQHAFDEVLQGYLKSNHRKKVEVIERAFRFAREAHKGVRRRDRKSVV